MKMSKKSIPLPMAYQRIYKTVYADYAASNGLLRKFTHFIESWYHKKVAELFTAKIPRILEVGCGSFESC